MSRANIKCPACSRLELDVDLHYCFHFISVTCIHFQYWFLHAKKNTHVGCYITVKAGMRKKSNQRKTVLFFIWVDDFFVIFMWRFATCPRSNNFLMLRAYSRRPNSLDTYRYTYRRSESEQRVWFHLIASELQIPAEKGKSLAVTNPDRPFALNRLNLRRPRYICILERMSLVSIRNLSLLTC